MERFKKPNEEMKYFEEIMRSSSTTIGSLNSSTKQGESSRNGELRNEKSKGKQTCYHYGKIAHTANIYIRKNGM